MATLLEANEVTKIYAKGQRPSLNKVSFNVAESEFIAIMGASGSGKTTLLNVLSTIDTPTSGSIIINGVNLKQLSDTGSADFRRDNLGFIFQEYFLLDSLTIRENISVPLTLQKLPHKKIEKMVRSLAERFGIASQLDKYPNELSGGQRQRASAARAIVKQPSILRVTFVFKSEWRHIIFSLIAVIVLFLTYYFSTMRVPEHLSNFGVYIPILLFWVSIHGIILKEQNSLPLSAVFSNRQLTLLIFSGVIIFSLIAIILNGGYSLLFIMLDALFAFLYVCNIALDFNFKKGHNKIIKESKYHVALQQLQREEQLNLEFANFLHDDILQDLLSVKNMMKKADRPEVQKIITETLDNMNTYIREQMQDYHPTLLPKLTIKENYQNLLDGISQSFPNRNICVSFDCSDSLFLVEPYNIFVYRLLKELVTNVYKHSTGEKAWITLTQDNGIIILSVSDNGTVDADVLSSADRLKHRGLAMITERVNDMDGSVTISNNHPHGICVQTILPMKGDVSYQHFVSR